MMSRGARTDLLIFGALSLGAFLLRIVYLAEIDSLVLFEHLTFDGARYDAWAHELAAGAWLGEGVFFQAPLYPYFLGILHGVFGHDLWILRGFQAGLGALACGFVYLGGSLLFDRRVGVLAGSMLALYAPAIFFDGLVQKAVMDVFLVSMLFALLAFGARRPEVRAVWGGAGAVLGLLTLTRENALIWVPLIPAWIWVGLGGARLERASRGAAFLVGLAVVLLPVSLRNYLVGGHFALTTSQFGANFYIGNNKDADGTYAPFKSGWGNPELEQQDIRDLAEKAVGRPLTSAEISDYWRDRTLADIRADPPRWIALLGRKSMLFVNARELEDGDDFYIYREHALVLRLLAPFSPFGLLLALAGAGAVSTRGSWRKLAILHALVLSLAASVVLFFVFGRYRISVVPLLVPLAAAWLVRSFDSIRAGRYREPVVGSLVGILLAVVAHWPVLDRPTPSPAGYNNLATALVKAGRNEEALSTFDKALDADPTSTEIRYNRANLLRDLGRTGEAESELRRVLERAPDFAEAHNNLGIVYGASGRREEAIASFRRALEVEPGLIEARQNLARALLRAGELGEAEKELRTALETRPDLAGLHLDLAGLLERTGRSEEARMHRRAAGLADENP